MPPPFICILSLWLCIWGCCGCWELEVLLLCRCKLFIRSQILFDNGKYWFSSFLARFLLKIKENYKILFKNLAKNLKHDELKGFSLVLRPCILIHFEFQDPTPKLKHQQNFILQVMIKIKIVFFVQAGLETSLKRILRWPWNSFN